MLREAAIRLVVFDCDGTLVDSQHHILAAMTAAFRDHGLDPPDAAAVRSLIGLPLVAIVGRLLPAHPPAAWEALAERYRQAFFALRQLPDHHEPLFPGTLEALDGLERAGFLLGIATGKARRGLDAVLASHAIADRFVTLQTADRAPGKPSPVMLQQAMAEAGADPASTVLVGDTTFDMQMARNAGVAAVGVAWGYHPAMELTEAGAVAVIDRFADLTPLAATLTGGN